MLMPRSVFGMNHLGARITVGQQIANVISYAISEGVYLQIGSLPTGEIPIPSEISNQTCAEVIAACLKLHPDWIPWIDHSTTPPSYNVTAVSDAVSENFNIGSGGISDISIARRDDLIPSSVYEWSTTIEDSVYRNLSVDKYPPTGPDGGPRVLQSHIQLAGLQSQIQKSRICVTPIPISSASAWAKDWIKVHNPALQSIDNGHFAIARLDSAVVSEPTQPDPISSQAPPLVVSSINQIPNELRSGTIEDWMRVHSGTARVEATLIPASGATHDERVLLAQNCQFYWQGTCTDAQTKIYKGVTSWIAAEQMPTGVAQATYEAIVAAFTYDGSITVKAQEALNVNLVGRKANVAGGAADWASMNAPIHSVSFDVERGETRISFGPVHHLAPADFLEMQRILRWRDVTWWSSSERASNKHGAQNDPSAHGDTVAGYHSPKSDTTTGGSSGETAWSSSFVGGQVSFENMELYPYLGATPFDIVGGGSSGQNITVVDGESIWLHIIFDALTGLVIDSVVIVADSDNHPPIVMSSATPPLQTDAWYELGACDSGHWISYVSSQLCVFSMVQDGRYAKYPLPL